MGFVGGLVAAFGCYPLTTYRTCSGWATDTGVSTHGTNYKELCEVTSCNLLQMLVFSIPSSVESFVSVVAAMDAFAG